MQDDRQAHDTPSAPTAAAVPIDGTTGPIGDPEGAVSEPMKCVWSGYPNYDRTCRSRIPMSVVVKAWQREMQLKGTLEGFFYFSWRSGVWLAYGLQDGGVRGVYCPTHCSERDARDARETGSPAGIALQ